MRTVGRHSDVDNTWADRTAHRGVAVGLASNSVHTLVAWPDLAGYYDPRVNVAAALVMLAGAWWYIWRVLRRTFNRRDLLVPLAACVVALVAIAMAPTVGTPPQALPWWHSWPMACVIGAILLLPRRQAWPWAAGLTMVFVYLRAPLESLSLALIEATAFLFGALITAWAARMANRRFDRARGALRAAAAAEAQVVQAQSAARAQRWWERLLHDKVLGALLLMARADTARRLAQARQLAAEALSTLAAIERSAGPGDTNPAPAGSDERGSGLKADLRGLAAAHGLRVDVTAEGRGAPTPVARAVLAAADQALRNVALHSGEEGGEISISESPTRVRVEITDHGRGFNPDTVGVRRLGLTSSIPGHMALVDGTARVRSARGRGTRVVLQWEEHGEVSHAVALGQAQLRSVAWVAVLFAGLHALGGFVGGAALPEVGLAWAGLALWLAANSVVFLGGRGRPTTLAVIAVVVGCALMLAGQTTPFPDGWQLWFLGASHSALCIPALRGRPGLTMAAGTGLAVVILAEFALRDPAAMRAAWQYAIPFVIIPGVAAAYAASLARADRRLRAAQAAESEAQRLLADLTARQAVVNERMTNLAEGTIPLLSRLVAGERLSSEDRELARLVEAANRDLLVAGDLLNPPLVNALAEARSRGVDATVTSTGVTPDVAGHGPVEDDCRPEFHATLIEMLAAATRGDDVTARWQPHNSYARATLTLCASEDPEMDRFVCLGVQQPPLDPDPSVPGVHEPRASISSPAPVHRLDPVTGIRWSA